MRKLCAAFDIGIKNLACCIIDSEKWCAFQKGESTDAGIVYWENLNLLGEPESCAALLKKSGNPCGKVAKWTDGEQYFCGRHHSEGMTAYKAPAVKNLNMNALKRTAFAALDGLPIFEEVTHILLESQPRINQRMKMFYAAIEAYFIIRYQLDRTTCKSIKSSPAKNKLKLYNGPAIPCEHLKKSYDRRKYTAVKQTEHFLEKCPQVLEKFQKNKKRDDLADAFLHCLIGLKTK